MNLKSAFEFRHTLFVVCREAVWGRETDFLKYASDA